jgi:hypothetical protein
VENGRKASGAGKEKNGVTTLETADTVGRIREVVEWAVEDSSPDSYASSAALQQGYLYCSKRLEVSQSDWSAKKPSPPTSTAGPTACYCPKPATLAEGPTSCLL